MIFVFGSNLAGRHGKGAALFAKINHGAEYGIGEGRTGNSYALPTKKANFQIRSLQDIESSVRKFVRYANENPEETFYVTPFGCGLANHRREDILEILRDQKMPENCVLAYTWINY